MIRRPPRSTPLYSSAASDVYKRQAISHRFQSVTELLPCSGLHFCNHQSPTLPAQDVHLSNRRTHITSDDLMSPGPQVVGSCFFSPPALVDGRKRPHIPSLFGYTTDAHVNLRFSHRVTTSGAGKKVQPERIRGDRALDLSWDDFQLPQSQLLRSHP